MTLPTVTTGPAAAVGQTGLTAYGQQTSATDPTRPTPVSVA